MKYLTPLLALLLTGCGMLHSGSSATPFGKTDTPSPPYTGSIKFKVASASVTSAPASPILIPITWPADWMNYKWQVWGTGDLRQPMTLLVSNVDMTKRLIDVPEFGACGLYECRTNGLVAALN